MSTFFSKSRNPGDEKQTSAAPSPEEGAQEVMAEADMGPVSPSVRAGAAPQGAATAAVAAPGVVPPVAAAMYSVPSGPGLPRSMPPAGSVPHSVPPAGAVPRVHSVAENAVSARVRMAKETQQSVQVAVQRTSAASSPARSGRRQPVQQVARHRPAEAPRRPRQPFDPSAYAQAGLLKLAWNWQQSGAPIRAIHTYMQLLIRYPGTPAAAAAVADLVEVADSLAEQGQFHTALSIYDQLEQLA